MEKSDSTDNNLTPDERRHENLTIVAGHHFQGSDDPDDHDQASDNGASATAKKLGPLSVALAFILGKFKWIFVILKATKLTTLISMVFAVWVYTQMWGFRYALGFILLIYVHEMGHLIMMKKMGVKAGAPVFIPFVGAVIAMKEVPKNARIESIVAIGGPLFGAAGAGICLVAGIYTGSPFWFALASTGFMLNLFNMLPVSPLDGGRITGGISRWFWLLGFILGGAVFFVTRSPMLLLVLIFGLFSFFNPKNQIHEDYYDLTPATRGGIALSYFSLIAVMATGMWMAEGPLKSLSGS